MAGNLMEWTADCRTNDLTATPVDGSANTADCNNRVLRGTAWAIPAINARSSNRTGAGGDRASNLIGFRVARDLE